MSRFDGEFSGFGPLLVWCGDLIRLLDRKGRLKLIEYVVVQLATIFLQLATLGVFYTSVKWFIEPPLADHGINRAYFLLHELGLSRMEILIVSAMPAPVLLYICSWLTRYCRVGYSRVALKMRDIVMRRFIDNGAIVSEEGIDILKAKVNGAFGAVRALFLNLFVLTQSIAALIALTYIEPLVGLLSIILYAAFFGRIANLPKLRASQLRTEVRQEMEIDADLSGELGLSSKSFERLERMRVIGRNASNLSLFVAIFVGIALSLQFVSAPELFTVALLLLRYVAQSYVPIAVISAACVPYKATIKMLTNVQRVAGNDRSPPERAPVDSVASTFDRRCALIVSRSASIAGPEYSDEDILVSLNELRPGTQAGVVSRNFQSRNLMSPNGIRLMRQKIDRFDQHATLLFYV